MTSCSNLKGEWEGREVGCKDKKSSQELRHRVSGTKLGRDHREVGEDPILIKVTQHVSYLLVPLR